MKGIQSFFQDWFSLDGFNVWKLQTPMDYVYFTLILAGGFFLIWLAIRALSSMRTPEGTTARMAKKLRRIGGTGAQVWQNVTVVSQRGRCVCPMLYAAREGVYVVQVYHFGLDVSGSASSKYWTLSFNKDVRQVDNPLDAMDEQIVVVNRVLAKAGLGHVPVEKLVLFADVYGRPRVDLRGVDCAVVRQDLNKWRKQKKNLPSVSLAELAKALEASFQR